MDVLVTTAVIIIMIVLGVLLIHRLNAQHGQRIAAFRYSDALPWHSDRSRTPHGGPTGPSDITTVTVSDPYSSLTGGVSDRGRGYDAEAARLLARHVAVYAPMSAK